MFACRYAYLDIVKYLSEKGAIFEREKGYASLHAACYGGDYQITRFLLAEKKINPNPESQEKIPLFIVLFAICQAQNQNELSEHPKILELLITNGAAYE